MIMKKLIIRFALTVACLTPSLPAYSTEPFIDTARSDHFIELGVHIGDGASTIRQNYSAQIPNVTDLILTPGNRFDVGFTAVLPLRNFFGIGTGIDFNVNNYYWSMTTLDRTSGSMGVINARSRYYTIELPAYLQFRFNLGSSVQWRNELGIYLDLGAGGHQVLKSLSSYTNELGQSQVTETSYRQKYYTMDDAAINGFNDLDWGMRLATSVVVRRHWSVGCVFNVGTRDVARNTGVFDVRVHNMNVTFKLGYIF